MVNALAISKIDKSAAGGHWKRVGAQPRHGIVTPLLALRGQTRQGCGTFDELLELIDLAKEVGIEVLQLLPLQDSGYDPSPYAALGAFSLNPVYISLAKAPLEKQQKQLLEKIDAQASVPYRYLRAEKLKILRSLFFKGWKRDKELEKEEILKNSHHYHYSCFMALKESYNLLPWWQWQESSLQKLASLSEEIFFYHYLQQLAAKQLLKATEQAKKAKVLLVGDLPILLCKDSADVFFNREIFNLELTAGAPPDQFSSEGQNWGFPTYRWDVMSRSNYQFWRERLAWAKNYFDLYRLDHIAGFFGLFSIPLDKTPKEGFYKPKELEARQELGNERLKRLLESSPMLPIGEDLGYIDPEIRVILEELGIPGICVMRWQREWEKAGKYIEPANYPVCSLACVSTHDSSTLREWFYEESEQAKALSSCLKIEHPKQWSCEWSRSILKACHHSSSLFHIDLLVDIFDAIEELKASPLERYRINVPGVVDDINWNLRYKFSCQKLKSVEFLKQFWKTLSLHNRQEQAQEQI